MTLREATLPGVDGVRGATDPAAAPAVGDTRQRRRITAAIFGAVAVGTIGQFAAVTVAPLVAVDLTGSATLSGLPTAALLAGTALGSNLISRVMARRGRRPGLVRGYLSGSAGALLAVAAVLAGSFALFVAGTLLLGFGNSANLLARYAAADAHPQSRRATVVGWIVWAGTLGAVIGPSLVDPVGRLVAGLSAPALAGGVVIAVVAFALSGMGSGALVRPDPGPGGTARPTGRPRASVGWRSPTVVVALTAMVAGQFTMVLLMTMTPVHAMGMGIGLAGVGVIMSSHVIGMYALTPVAGWLADRVGHLLVIGLGMLVLVVASVAAALSPPGAAGTLAAALFLLGLGWSLGFVAASGLMAGGVPSADQARMQGAVDTAVFGAAATASVMSGVLISAVGFVGLCLLGAAALVGPAIVVARTAPAVVRTAP